MYSLLYSRFRLFLRNRHTRYALYAFLFLFFAGTFIRAFFIDSFFIPSSSMEGAFLPGDQIFCVKYHPERKIKPHAPQEQLVKQEASFLPKESLLKRLRKLYSYTPPSAGETVIFQHPTEPFTEENTVNYYLKRIAAQPGDTIALRNGLAFRNGKPEANPEKRLHRYLAVTQVRLPKDFFKSYGIRHAHRAPGGYAVDASEKAAKALRRLPYIAALFPMDKREGDYNAETFPHSEYFSWNQDQFGPLWTPKAGETLPMTPENVRIYAETIRQHENTGEVSVKLGQLFIEGQHQESYTFQKNYYFMLGDNRDNSEDSRHWGFVPEEKLFGEPFMIYFSQEDQAQQQGEVRWQRLFASDF